MANILSQNEIDELLSALASGIDTTSNDEAEQETGKVREYNFRTANKFPKEQIRTLHFILENYAVRLSSYLSGTLRVICETEVISIEEQTFSEFNNSIPSPVVLAIINMPPLQGSSLLEISPTIAYEIISRLFGGTGQEHDTEKPFTEIEIAILVRVIRQMLDLMGEAWERVASVSASLDRIETSSQFAQIVAANEPIAIITMNVKIGEVSDMINLCIPHVAVQPIAKQLSMRMFYSDGSIQQGADINVDNMKPNLSKTYLTLHAKFDDTYGTVRDILSLQVGDVIRVDHSINEPITVLVEHIPKFKGYIGRHKSKYAVKITDILKEETEDE